MANTRITATHSHDDGVNAWRMTRIAPSSTLIGQIDAYCDYWESTGGFTVRRELPHAEGVLIVNLGPPIMITAGNGARLTLAAGEAFVAGAHLLPALSHSDGTQAGMHVFLPLATLRRLLGVPMDGLLNRVARLDDLLGPGARRLGQRLSEARDVAGRAAFLDDALAQRLAAMPALDRQQRHALEALRHRPGDDIAAIARDIGWSRKHFAARVRDAVGVGPRCFRRLLRFQRLIARIGGEGGASDWADLALDAGYCDQSHMIREFREFSGLTPQLYRARSLPDGGGLIEA
ncbi:MAG: helix-turn-helix transcriptional regulator [Sphingomonadaceae bacterium]|nr:helix-turn-helix transcriptional regulator [Sphingomonadaceae bacterium]